MKKILSIILATTLAAASFVGCSSSEAEGGAGQTSQMNMNSFETTTLAGDTVNQDILADYDLTMVNIWATWCPPCIAEMPDLVEVHESLPENVNMITFSEDSDREPELAQEIIDSVSAKFMVMTPSESITANITSYITAFPTTIFVDSTGNVVGEPIIGAPGQEGEITAAYLAAIDERLATLGV